LFSKFGVLSTLLRKAYGGQASESARLFGPKTLLDLPNIGEFLERLALGGPAWFEGGGLWPNVQPSFAKLRRAGVQLKRESA
jgi:hypothetical protein